jgi:hypothetical protein
VTSAAAWQVEPAKRSPSTTTANLLLVDFQGVAVLHLKLLRVSGMVARGSASTSELSDVFFLAYRVWVVLRCDTLPIKEEAHAGDVLALAIAKGIHELSEGRGAFDLEKDLIVVVRDLDIQVLALATIFRLLLHVWRTVVRHIVGGFGPLGYGRDFGCS